MWVYRKKAQRIEKPKEESRKEGKKKTQHEMKVDDLDEYQTARAFSFV